jgi:hypothetical protein
MRFHALKCQFGQDQTYLGLSLSDFAITNLNIDVGIVQALATLHFL